MKDHTARDVVAPRAALAWASGAADRPGRWLYDEADIITARQRGELIRRTDTDPRASHTWLRDVGGHAPLADLIRVTTDVDALRVALLDLVETAAATLARRNE